MRQPMGQCFVCVHWEDNNENDEPVCAAFPDGIPEQIMLGRMDHRKAIPGDNGVRFEPKPGTSARRLELLEQEMAE